jgi:putative redox protein
MTIRLYADRKKWPLEKVSVQLAHDKEHMEDCAVCDEREERIDVFRRLIRLEGELDSTQRERLLEIADKCPVHRTLEKGAKVETRLE